MLKSVKRKWSKTPVENNSTIVREIPSIDSDSVTHLLSSSYLGEGVYGFEVVSENGELETFLISPSLFRGPIGTEVHRDYHYITQDLMNLHCFDIVLSSPSFLPLYTKEPFSIFENLIMLLQKKQMYLQCLFTKRTDNWQLGYIDQYESYVKAGNEFPSASRFKRKLQERVLKAIDKISGNESSKEKVPEIEQKILDHGYRFELRLMFYSNEDTRPLESEIKDILKEINFFNDLVLIKNKQKREFLDLFLKRKYSVHSVDQMVSEAELLVILSGDITRKPNSIIQVMEKTKEEVITNRNFTGSAIGLLPKPKQKHERAVDAVVSDMLPEALKTAKALKQDQKIKIKSVETGPTVQIITCEIPKGAVYSDFKKRHEDIEAVLAKSKMLSIIPGREPNTISFLLPLKQKEVIYLVEILQSPEFNKFAESAELPFICGIDIFNQFVFKDLEKAPHLLICGATNSGKSVFLNAFIIALILMKKPDELRMIMIDPKQVELQPYDGLAHVDDLITDMNEAYETLESLCEEMDKRYTAFSKVGVRKISQYNKKVKKKMPYIVAVIEEYADLKAVQPDVETQVARLGAKARAAGVHLVIVTQKPNKDVISKVLQNNLPAKICFKVSDANSDYIPIFGSGIPFRLLGYGDGVVTFPDQSEPFIRFQSACISPDSDEEQTALEDIKKYFNGEKVEGLELEKATKPINEEPIDKLKRIIMGTGETRLKPLQEAMNIRMEEVSNMMKQLVEEGFLAREGKSYVIASQSETVKNSDYEAEGEGANDPLFEEAVNLVIELNAASISALQRRFRIGYSRAARMIDAMEEWKIVSPYDGVNSRIVLITKEDWENRQ